MDGVFTHTELLTVVSLDDAARATAALDLRRALNYQAQGGK